MPPFDRFAAMRPRRLRQPSAPKTPEPFTDSQQPQPSSPPRPRFRIRRRAASQINAPTQQFLASVAAADVPIPSIEKPQIYDEDQDLDDTMLSVAYPPVPPHLDRIDVAVYDEHADHRGTFSPPKTPAPGLAPSLSPKQFPDWSIDAAFSSLESSPDYGSSRPSTARSTQTSASLFSRFSYTSEELSQCASPDSEHGDRFGPLLAPEDAGKTIRPVAPLRSAKLRRAPWTRAMTQHLWSTYLMYLQDPKVTPFRTGKSGIPPSGVCMRVAREAKRSWKGSRPTSRLDHKSGSSTPTAESAGRFIEWPHTCAATRGHLRELCKANSGGASRNLRLHSKSPTPLGKTANRAYNRRAASAAAAAAATPSVFSGSDMAVSLAVSTSESMQPHGPLARLTSSQREPIMETQIKEDTAMGGARETVLPPLRLGSPFAARSYGPSSSAALADGTSSFNISPESARRPSYTLGVRRELGSPVQLDQSRPGTQKRRSGQPTAEPRRTKRPSLGSDFWTAPSDGMEEQRPAPFHEYSSTDRGQRDNLFVPRTNLQELFEASQQAPQAAAAPPSTLTASHTVPARLGSPFSGSRASHSVPNRHSTSQSVDLGAASRPFATVHQGVEKPAKPSTGKTSLANRLAYIDERLKHFRPRDSTSDRRSQSPFERT